MQQSAISNQHRSKSGGHAGMAAIGSQERHFGYAQNSSRSLGSMFPGDGSWPKSLSSPLIESALK